MRVALVHDWITGLRGGEKCLLDFLSIYPEADVFTLVHKAGTTSPIIDERVKECSFLQHLPNPAKLYKAYLPLYPFAAKSLHIEGYDLVISLSHAAVKNIKTDAYHISYCFTPMRYIWDQAPHYFGKALPLAYPLIKTLRIWDKAGSAGVNLFVPISKFVAARVRKFYGRKSEVIYPAVNTDWITPREDGKRGDFFLYAGALVPYKRVDLIVAACSKLNLPLVVAGVPNKQLQELAGSSVKFIGKVNNDELAKLYRDCRALIFPAKEDFGMIPIECMAAGRPVIGLGAGGVRETVLGLRVGEPFSKEATGVFINNSEDKLEALIDAIKYFETVEDKFLAESCVKQAQKFSPDVFFSAWHDLAKRYGF